MSGRARRRAVPEADDGDTPPRRARLVQGSRRRQAIQKREPDEEEEEEEEDEGDEGEEEYDEEGEEDDGEEEDEEEEESGRRRRRPHAQLQSQSQAQSQAQSQSQRRKKRQRRSAASEGELDENEDNEYEDEGGDDQDREKAYLELLSKKLVRYALACEPRRQPIRRQAVKEHVLDNQGKNFRKVFPSAQEQLRSIFGMEMVEWPARDEATMSLRERRKALKSQKNTAGTAGAAAAASTPSATQTAAPAAASRADRYVLVSTLPEAYREAIFTPLAGTNNSSSSSNKDSVIAPVPPAPDAAYVGFCTLVVSLITLNGGTLAHADLEKYLTLLYGARRGPVRADAELLQPVSAAMGDHIDDDDGGTGAHHDGDDSTGGGGTLQYLVRQGYIVRVVEESTTAEGRGPVGGRSANGSGANNNNQVTWHVGPRGRLEIGPAEVAQVVRHVYGPAANADLDRRLKSSLMRKGRGGSGGDGPNRGERVEAA